MIIGLTADSTSMSDLRTIADRTIRPRLLAMGGVSQVSVIGGDIKEYQIRISPESMRHYGVTLDEVMTAVNGINDNASGGVLYEYGNEYLIKADINTTSTEDIGQAVVRSRQQRYSTGFRHRRCKPGTQASAHRHSFRRGTPGRNTHRNKTTGSRHNSP